MKTHTSNKKYLKVNNTTALKLTRSNMIWKAICMTCFYEKYFFNAIHIQILEKKDIYLLEISIKMTEWEIYRVIVYIKLPSHPLGTGEKWTMCRNYITYSSFIDQRPAIKVHWLAHTESEYRELYLLRQPENFLQKF